MPHRSRDGVNVVIAKTLATTALSALNAAAFAIDSCRSIAVCSSDEEVAVRTTGYVANATIDGHDGEPARSDTYCAQAKHVYRIGDGYADIRINVVAGSEHPRPQVRSLFI
jgi:hypothetical protein